MAAVRNHVHLVVEATDPVALARAVQGMAIRMASGDWMDPYSSAAWFTGWVASGPPLYGPAPVVPPAPPSRRRQWVR
jgi:hypothetical protein